MKKGLLTILGAASLSTLALAQETDPFAGYSEKWMDSVNNFYAVKLDLTNRVEGLKGLTKDTTAAYWGVSTWGAANLEQSIEVKEDKLIVSSKRIGAKANWQDITLAWNGWVGGSGEKFGPKADTMVGYYVDLSGKKVITATVKSNVPATVRFDLIDVNGNISNSKSPKQEIAAGEADYTWIFDADTLFNFYGEDNWGTFVGRGGKASGLYHVDENGDSTQVTAFADGDAIPFDISKVVKIAMIVNENLDGVAGEQVTVEISNMTIGNSAKAKEIGYYVEGGSLKYVPENVTPVPFGKVVPKYVDGEIVTEYTTVASATLTVSPNPATTTITVNEEAVVYTALGVATPVAGIGTLDISVLTPGTYYVVSESGSVTLSVQ